MPTSATHSPNTQVILLWRRQRVIVVLWKSVDSGNGCGLLSYFSSDLESNPACVVCTIILYVPLSCIFLVLIYMGKSECGMQETQDMKSI